MSLYDAIHKSFKNKCQAIIKFQRHAIVMQVAPVNMRTVYYRLWYIVKWDPPNDFVQ